MSCRHINFHEGGLVVKFSGKIFLPPPSIKFETGEFPVILSLGKAYFCFTLTLSVQLFRVPALCGDLYRLPIFDIPRISLLNLGLSSVLVNTLKLAL